jgi:L-amino acid N-acyltransferase YncA
MSAAVTLRSMRPSDWPAVQRIYQEGIDTGHATFESSAPDWPSSDQPKLPAHRHVATTEDIDILGWASVARVLATGLGRSG